MKGSKIEISSDQLRNELQEIKERLGTLEAIDAYVNRDKLVAMIKTAIGSSAQRKSIVRLCETPQTREQLQAALSLNSLPALDHHLNPLRDLNIIEATEVEGKTAFIRARILGKLPRSEIKKLVG